VIFKTSVLRRIISDILEVAPSAPKRLKAAAQAELMPYSTIVVSFQALQ
jgi:hypothetical protein